MSIKIAMLGTGKIAEEQLTPALNLAEGGVLWGVLSRVRDRAADFAARHQAHSPDPGFEDLDALLADPALDAVIIASPDALHAEQAIRAARAGKHVFCEKPMTTTREDARATVDVCAAESVKLGVAYHMRWHAGHRVLASRVHAGELGELRHMRVQWTHKATDDTNWRAHGEVGRWWGLAGVGTHCLDQVRWFLLPGCGEVREVRSVVSRSVWKGPHDETAVVALEFESGATAEITTSVLFDAPKRMEVYGTNDFAICDNTLGLSGGGDIRIGSGSLSFEPKNPYVGEIEDFIDAIRNDREPEVTGEEGLRNVDILLQAVGA